MTILFIIGYIFGICVLYTVIHICTIKPNNFLLLWYVYKNRKKLNILGKSVYMLHGLIETEDKAIGVSKNYFLQSIELKCYHDGVKQYTKFSIVGFSMIDLIIYPIYNLFNINKYIEIDFVNKRISDVDFNTLLIEKGNNLIRKNKIKKILK